jgi:hypothetical protein
MTHLFPISKNKFATLALSVVALMPSLALAQATGTFSAVASVVQPLTIASASTLSFGDFAAGSEEGRIVISSTGLTRTASGGARLVNSNSGTPSTIVIASTPGSTYSVSLPSTFTLGTLNGATMEIVAFSTNLQEKGVIPDSGRGSFQIGGTLKVAANQAGGSYSGMVPITINYP